jgi:hypothetical protein
VSDKFIRPEHCVKTWPNTACKGPMLRRRRSVNIESEAAFSEDDGLKIRHDPYNLRRSLSPYFSKIPPIFKILFRALLGLEHKMIYLNPWLKHLYKRGIRASMRFYCHVERFSFRQSVAREKSSREHLIFFTPFLQSFHKPPSARSFAIQVKNFCITFLLNYLDFSPRQKSVLRTTARTVV